MRLWSEIKAGLSPIVDLIYPPRCPACGEAVSNQGGLCLDCWQQLEEPIDQSDIIAASLYNGISRQLVLNFKYGGKIALAKLFARMIAAKLPETQGDNAPLLVPVPLHRLRLWERGFNQSALLARELAKLGKGKLLIDGMKRTKRTTPLGGLNHEERWAELKDAIIVPENKRSRIEGQNVLLIDDVHTSGATSSACVEALKEAGAKSVQIACFARVGQS